MTIINRFFLDDLEMRHARRISTMGKNFLINVTKNVIPANKNNLRDVIGNEEMVLPGLVYWPRRVTWRECNMIISELIL